MKKKEDSGIIYIMTTAVSGLIKIGQTQLENFKERMRFLESNGYYNVVGLKRYFAVKVDNYKDKEKLIIEIFGKHRVGESELFALDVELAKQLLSAFAGEPVFPETVKQQECEFEKVTKAKIGRAHV